MVCNNFQYGAFSLIWLCEGDPFLSGLAAFRNASSSRTTVVTESQEPSTPRSPGPLPSPGKDRAGDGMEGMEIKTRKEKPGSLHFCTSFLFMWAFRTVSA